MEKWRIQRGIATVEIETRADDETQKTEQRLKGYATVYGAYTQIFWGEWRETVAPGAYDESVANDDICTLWQHDSREVLGRKSSGTMRVWSDDVGVGYSTLPPSTAANRVESVARGDVKDSSIGFDALEEEWGQDPELEDIWLRTIHKATMWEASPVTWPAVLDTSVGVVEATRNIDGLGLANLPADLRWQEEAGRMRIVTRTQSPGVDVEGVAEARKLLARTQSEIIALERAALAA